MEPEYALYYSFLTSVAPITQEEWDVFAQGLEKRAFKKNEALSKYGKTENYIHFITKGFVKVYVMIDGKKNCTNFRFKGEPSSSITSYITRQPSLYEIIALEDVETLSIHYNNLSKIYEHSLGFNIAGRKIIEGLYVQKHLREISFLSMSATERYLSLIQENPHYIEQISSRDIASYLGIYPESLSRIKKEVHQKGLLS